MINRRSFLELGALATGAMFVRPVLAQAPQSFPAGDFVPSDMANRFRSWFLDHALERRPGARNMVYNFYNTKKKQGEWIYPMLSGKAMLWLLHHGKVAEAQRLAQAVLRWQQINNSGSGKKSFGAFPSKVKEHNGAFSAGERYYSGDNLVLLQALLALYGKTGQSKLLNSAIGIGNWLTQTMCQGHKLGIWKQNHGAPVWFVTQKGDFSNHIGCHMEALWIGALTTLTQVTGEKSYAQQAAEANAFYRLGQGTNGAYYDHYDPGYPAKPYSSGNWKTFGPGQFVADNVLRSALAACLRGEVASAKRFYQWLKVEQGGIPAYLDSTTGGSGFPVPEEKYYDLASTAMHRCLCLFLAEPRAAQADLDFIRRTQQPNGGWYWGYRADNLQPIRPEQAPVGGFWATANLLGSVQSVDK